MKRATEEAEAGTSKMPRLEEDVGPTENSQHPDEDMEIIVREISDDNMESRSKEQNLDKRNDHDDSEDDDNENAHYNSTVSDELRQFDVLDDLDRHQDPNDSDNDTNSNVSIDSDVPDEEIEAMLEESMQKLIFSYSSKLISFFFQCSFLFLFQVCLKSTKRKGEETTKTRVFLMRKRKN